LETDGTVSELTEEDIEQLLSGVKELEEVLYSDLQEVTSVVAEEVL